MHESNYWVCGRCPHTHQTPSYVTNAEHHCPRNSNELSPMTRWTNREAFESLVHHQATQ
jgi:hypothetical protein